MIRHRPVRATAESYPTTYDRRGRVHRYIVKRDVYIAGETDNDAYVKVNAKQLIAALPLSDTTKSHLYPGVPNLAVVCFTPKDASNAMSEISQSELRRRLSHQLGICPPELRCRLGEAALFGKLNRRDAAVHLGFRLEDPEGRVVTNPEGATQDYIEAQLESERMQFIEAAGVDDDPYIIEPNLLVSEHFTRISAMKAEARVKAEMSNDIDILLTEPYLAPVYGKGPALR